MNNLRKTLVSASGLALAATVVALLAGSCSTSEEPANARAFRVENRSQLIGGPTALGDVGDYMLENGRVRVLIQDKDFNRGAGVFGGSLIDADLARATNDGDALGGSGNDSFGEMFPAFFLEMIDPQEINVINDGADGTAAIVEVRGKGGEFVTMLRYLNQLLVNSYKEPSVVVGEILDRQPPDSDAPPNLEFSTRYILEPGARHVRIESTMQNISVLPLDFPPQQIIQALAGLAGIDLGNFRLPMGHVLGFGKLSEIFLPGLGYDIELGLRDAGSEPIDLPAFPGFLTPVVASTNSHGVNYGFLTEDNPDTNFVYQRDQDNLYGGRAGTDDMLYLFNASGFGGVFSAEAPRTLAPSHCADGLDAQSVCETLFPEHLNRCTAQWDNCIASRAEFSDSFTYVTYLVIGDGDVASIMEEFYEIRGTDVASVRGRVVDSRSGAPVAPRESVLIYQDTGSSCEDARIYNQAYTLAEGRFVLDLPEGKYCARAQAAGRPLGDFARFEVDGDSAPFVELKAEARGRIVAQVTGEDGTPLPAKLTVVGTHEYVENPNYREFLMDQVSGDPWRPTDLVPDDPNDPSTRRYIEDMAYGGADGLVSIDVRPGSYHVYVSRGVEYDIDVRQIEVAPGGTKRVTVTLPRVLDTTGYVSGDFHLHAAGSIDSGLDFNRRVISIAAEGVEVVTSTEHNYISDFEPYVYRNRLNPFLKSIVGLELTTFEAGHFNAFPLERTLRSMNRGSFAWQNIPPGQIFTQLREMAPEGQDNIIQVNHPRTPILGYFEQHNVNPFDGTVTLPINEASGGFSADTLASPNGSAFIERTERADGDVEYSSTFSWDFDAIEIFNGPHIEELRHFRMPYDKDAGANSPGGLPDEVRQGLKDSFLDDLDDGDVDELVAEFLNARDGTDLTEEDVAALPEAERNAAVDAWVHARIPQQWSILCDGDDVVHPGALDDWYNLLNHPRPDGRYMKYTATGNSDSHSDHLDPPGLPRNFFWVGHDNPERVTEAQVVEALANRHNIVSNGPFINMTIDGQPVGSELSASGSVEVEIEIQAAPWVGADRFRLVANGEVVRDLDAAQTDDYWGWVPVDLSDGGKWSGTFNVPVQKDTWFVLEVESDKSMFPVIEPQDIPPFNFSDVIGGLAGAFGFGAGVPGLEPQFVFPMTGFAFTNPVWVIADGDGVFTPPSPPVYECVEGEYVSRDGQPNALVAPESFEEAHGGRLNAVSVPGIHHERSPLARPRGEARDLRVIFEAWGHNH